MKKEKIEPKIEGIRWGTDEAERIAWCKPGEELGIKRFYLPGVTITDECTKCGAEYKTDLGDHYLSYPIIGKNTFTAYCECGHEWDIKVILGVALSLDKSK